MTVQNLIDALKQYPPGVEIFLRDPDTGWKMPICIDYDNVGRGQKHGKGYGAVSITGEYHEAERD